MSVREEKIEKQRLYDLGWRQADGHVSDIMYEWFCDNCKGFRFLSDCPDCGRCERCYTCGSSKIRPDRRGRERQ